MPADQIQYSEKYFDAVYEYRYKSYKEATCDCKGILLTNFLFIQFV